MQTQTEKLLTEKVFDLTQENKKLREDIVSFHEIELELEEANLECQELESFNDDLQFDIDEKNEKIEQLEKDIKKLKNFQNSSCQIFEQIVTRSSNLSFNYNYISHLTKQSKEILGKIKSV